MSSKTALSDMLGCALNNLQQSLPIFLVVAILSIILEVDNLILGQTLLGLRVLYLLGAVMNLYRFKMVRPIVWLPSIVILVCMGCNLYI